MTQTLSPAQVAQQHNRDAGGRYAEQLRTDPGSLDLEPEGICCYECGGEAVIEPDGTAYHLTDDGAVDYDLDADHTPLDDAQFAVDHDEDDLDR